MARLVLKFGGTSVADPDRIKNVAAKVKREVDLGHQCCVVVSAMAGETNRLVDFCRRIDPMHDQREYDVVVATGEQVTIGLTAMALQAIGVPSRSYCGWQVPVLTNEAFGKARIERIDGQSLLGDMATGVVPVVAGFQGLGPGSRVATLGRGGSDTSAVALAAALGADRCDIYTDVDGVYTADPRIVKSARKLDRITYEEMLELASLGAKVLQTRSVELAMNHRVRVQVLSSFDQALGSELPGTLVVDEDEIVEKQIVSGVTYAPDEAKVTLRQVADRPGIAASIFGALADAGINVDMIVQNVSTDARSTDMTFTIPRGDLPRALPVLDGLKKEIGHTAIVPDQNVTKVSVVGVGMRSHAGVARTMFKALADKNINVEVISTSEIKISVLIAAEYTELAVRALHTAFDLDAA